MKTQPVKSLLKILGLTIIGVLCAGLTQNSESAVRFEHLAINVDNPQQVADWYVKYVGLEILSVSKKMIFVRDPGSHFMLELYHKPEAKGSFSSMNHAAGHVAFAVDDAEALANRMATGGAKIHDRTTNPAGDTVVNMIDPWGNKVQLIHRVKPKL